MEVNTTQPWKCLEIYGKANVDGNLVAEATYAAMIMND